MMKQKTHSGLKKRIKKTGSGKLMVEKSCKRHLLDNKSKKQKKLGKGGIAVNPSRLKSVKKLLVI
ncbi:50S ribosomal protein L35 [Patescibacteria group bacterium]|nr:50S ribosomal protein L35 [Patescibacteria group bacterium]